MAVPLFPLGRIVATPGALNLLVIAGQDPGELLDRHRSGDWGDVPPEDAAENRRSRSAQLACLELLPGRIGSHLDHHRGRQVEHLLAPPR